MGAEDARIREGRPDYIGTIGNCDRDLIFLSRVQE